MKLTFTTHPDFDRDELARYSRQLLMPEWGPAGQKAVRAAKVVIIGVGGLGSPAARYLAAAGVGELQLIDDDVVATSNLHRQLLFYPADVGEPKAAAAKKRLTEQFPRCRITASVAKAEASTIAALLEGASVVIDATDNFTSRYLINDACVRAGIPLCHASIGKFSGQASVFLPKGPCYRCLFPAPPPPGAVPNCDVAGVIGVLPGTMALIQATEALKLITGAGQSLAGRVLLYDSMAMSFQILALNKHADCSACGVSSSAAASQAPTARARKTPAPLSPETSERLNEVMPGDITSLADNTLIVDVREPAERLIAAVEPSMALPLPQLLAGAPFGELPRHLPIIVLCKTGVRAKRAAKYLLAQGYEDVRVLAGGISAYEAFVDRGQSY